MTRMPLRMVAAATVCVAVSGCGTQFKPETLVETLRVLAVQADPPEIRPGETSNLSILWGDPSRPGGTTTIIWVGCDPDPQDLGRSACNDATILLKPTQITSYPPGLKLLAFGRTAVYTAPPSTFDPIPADSSIRSNGTVGQVLAVVIGAGASPTDTAEQLDELLAKIESKQVQTVLSLSRILVSERATTNVNPKLERLVVDGVPQPRGARLQVKVGRDYKLGAIVPASAKESYTLKQPEGEKQLTEEVIGAWYSSAGRFDKPRFNIDTTEPSIFTAPGSDKVADDPVPEKKTGNVWLVLRDSRGGQTFNDFPFVVCDETQPSARVTSLTAADGQITVKGENLNQAVDVIVGDAALPKGAFSSATGNYLGDVPNLAKGEYDVKIRSKNCTEEATGLKFTVQ